MRRSCGCACRGSCASAPAVTRQEAALYAGTNGMTVVTTQSADATGGFVPVLSTMETTTNSGSRCTSCQRRRSAAGTAIFSAPGISMPGVQRMGRDGYRFE